MMGFVPHPVDESVVVVGALDRKGACAQHGLRVGDTICAINGSPPVGPKHALNLLDRLWEESEAESEPSLVRPVEEAEAVDGPGGVHGRAAVAGGVIPASTAASGAALCITLADHTRDLVVISRPPEEVGLHLAAIQHTKIVGENEWLMPRFGVLVKRVAEGSPAEAAGFEPGHVICSVNGKLATCAKQVSGEMFEQRGESGVASAVVSQFKQPVSSFGLDEHQELLVNIVVDS